jgi:hypothetical protein
MADRLAFAAYYRARLQAAKAAGYKNLEDQVLRRYREIGSALRVAKEIGVNQKTILLWLRRLDEPIKPRGGRTHAHPEAHRVRSEYERLGSGPAVARELNMSSRTVYNYLDALGVPRIKREAHNG